MTCAKKNKSIEILNTFKKVKTDKLKEMVSERLRKA